MHVFRGIHNYLIMGILKLSLSIFLICGVLKLSDASGGADFKTGIWSPQPDVCQPGPKGRVPWIIHVRDLDYGWREHTHRAMIALAVNDYSGEGAEQKKMELQLEIELTKDLFRNKTHPIHDSDLALYIHALMATNKNPRNFHGIDLVADLLRRVEHATGTGKVNPFLVLALCNAHAVKYEHLYEISKFANITHENGYPDVNSHADVDSRIAQVKALVYKALACGTRYDSRSNKFYDEMQTIVNCLHKKYNEENGSFGNVYTTSLAVQAFTAVPNPPRWWDKSKSLEYLERESEIDVNLIKAYYIEMALNAQKYNFIRDLYKGPPIEPYKGKPMADAHYIQYTVKPSLEPSMYFTVTLKVESGANFYDVMKIASNVSAAFNFTAYENNIGDPMVYSVSGIPNDIEENMFWRLCRQTDVVHEDRHTSTIVPYDASLMNVLPKKVDHYIYQYSNQECQLS